MLLNVRECARELNVSPHTIRAWAYQRRLPVVRLGRKVLFRKEDIEAFIKRNVVGAKNEG
jgi:excisionase family DNA binding protein